jgi:hypothetical protein
VRTIGLTVAEGLGDASLLPPILLQVVVGILELTIEPTPEFSFTLLHAVDPESAGIAVTLEPISAILEAVLPIKRVSRRVVPREKEERNRHYDD